VFAVTINWKSGSNDDVDLYVRDPNMNIAYFANPSVGLMHLEHDDLGTATSGVESYNGGQKKVLFNGERTVLTGFIPGEYVVNVHFYTQSDPGPIKVLVRLWSLRGEDNVLIQRTVTLYRQGDETTVFRFTLNRAGNVIRITHTQISLVGGYSHRQVLG